MAYFVVPGWVYRIFVADPRHPLYLKLLMYGTVSKGRTWQICFSDYTPSAIRTKAYTMFTHVQEVLKV